MARAEPSWQEQSRRGKSRATVGEALDTRCCSCASAPLRQRSTSVTKQGCRRRLGQAGEEGAAAHVARLCDWWSAGQRVQAPAAGGLQVGGQPELAGCKCWGRCPDNTPSTANTPTTPRRPAVLFVTMTLPAATTSRSDAALYFPWIHFRSERWLKSAALYWPRISRIVPRGHRLQDGPTTRKLQDNLGLIWDIHPDQGAQRLERDMIDVVEANAPALQAAFQLKTRLARMRAWNPNIIYVASPKMSRRLAESLMDKGLAIRGRGGEDYGWLGLHPHLARFYLSALATEIAASHHLVPVTDGTTEYSGTFASSLADLLRTSTGVGSPPQLPPASEDAVRDQFAMLALESVLPANMDALPVESIIRLRQRHGELFFAYRDAVTNLVGDVSTLVGVDEDARIEHLKIAVEREIKPRLKDLDRVISDVGLASQRGGVVAKVKMVGSVVTGGAAAVLAGPVALDVAGLAATVTYVAGSLVRGERIRRREALAASPVSYLWQIKDTTAAPPLSAKIAHLVNGALGG